MIAPSFLILDATFQQKRLWKGPLKKAATTARERPELNSGTAAASNKMPATIGDFNQPHPRGNPA
jgi:hypothetical protein